MKNFNVLFLHFKSVILSALIFAVFGLTTVSGASFGLMLEEENSIQLVERLSPDLETYPWQVAVFQTEGTDRKFCAGSLIHSEWVLTSADCVSNRDLISTSVSGEKVSKNAHLNGDGQNRMAAQIIIHPEYNSSTWENNIALIKLESPMNLGPLLNIIPLMTSEWVKLGMQEPGVIAAVTGWGTTIEGAVGDNRLRMGLMPITNNLGNLIADQIKPDMILAGNPQQTNNFCFGDTGGPMAVKDNSSPVGHRLAGINNKGFGCYGSGNPGVFTSVASHYEWILSHTGIVVPEPEENFVFVNFFANKTLLYETETVVFTDASAGADITSWQWNFGLDADPANATGQGPHSVIWNSFGKKTISLTVNGDATDTKVDYIDVIKLPTLTVNIQGSGEVKVEDNVYSEPVKTFPGTTLNIEAIASTYWRFEGWSGDLISLNETETILIDIERTVTALFVELIKPNVVWPEASAITWGQELSESAFTGGSASWEENPVAGIFSFDAPDFKPETGTYEADATFYPEDTANYQPVKGSVSVQVNKIVPVINAWPVASAIIYGEGLATSALTGGEASVDGTFAFDSPAVTPDAGTFTADVTFTPDDTDNYETVSGTVDVLVNKATPEVIAWPVASAIIYGEGLATSALTGGETSADGTFAFDNPAVTPVAGTYTADVTFTPDDTDNYVTVSGTVDVLVNKAEAQIILTELSHTYNAQTKQAIIETIPADLQIVVTYNGSTDLPVAADNYTLLAVVEDNNFFGTSEGLLTISKATLTITANSFMKTFGKEYIFTGSEYSVDELFGTDQILSVNISSEGASAVAETDTYAILISEATGNGLENYNISYVSGILTVTDLITLTIEGIVAENKVYDGSRNAVISDWGMLIGIDEDDDVELDFSEYEALFNHKNVGDNIPVTISNLKLQGEDAYKYIIDAQTSAADIDFKKLYITGTFEVSDKTYDGTTAATIVENNLNLEGVVPGEMVELIQLTVRFTSVEPQEDIEVEIAVAAITGDDSPNYLLSLDDAPFAMASIFARQYNLTLNLVGEGSVEVEGTAYTVTVTVDEGTVLKLEALALTGWKFDGWSGGLTSDDPIVNITIDQDKEIIATFSLIPTPQFTLTINVEGQGSVEVNGELYLSTITVDEGTTMNIEVLASEGWLFESWTGGLTSDLPVVSITMDGDITLNAIFVEEVIVPELFNLTLLAEPDEAVTITGEGQYEEGEQVTVTASSTGSYTFLYWADGDGNMVSEEVSYSFAMPANDLTLIAKFDIEDSVDDIINISARIFPNPAANEVIITFGSIITEIALVDISGKTIYRSNPADDRVIIPVNTYNPGVYFVRISSDNKTVIRKLIIKR